eukprot:TRINITY_DN2930_c0_g1_i1.p1 TRINITY_DN2930_c0_g1~~TRINITY_DN2930_c0_g1_i1.p1  ORF type:complete len:1587 (-),score=298.78 TRINITY_DN2930_c0_g1_i1:135-4202(-)
MTGTLPKRLGYLQSLDVSNNLFQGSVPSSLRDITDTGLNVRINGNYLCPLPDWCTISSQCKQRGPPNFCMKTNVPLSLSPFGGSITIIGSNFGYEGVPDTYAKNMQIIVGSNETICNNITIINSNTMAAQCMSWKETTSPSSSSSSCTDVIMRSSAAAYTSYVPMTIYDSFSGFSTYGNVTIRLPQLRMGPAFLSRPLPPTSGGSVTFDVVTFSSSVGVYIASVATICEYFESINQVTCPIPPGVGRAPSVVLSMGVNCSIDQPDIVFSYQVPSMSSVSTATPDIPSSSLSSSNTWGLLIEGANFGEYAGDVQVIVGGYLCPFVRMVVPHVQLLCTLDTSYEMPPFGTRTNVTVVVGNQASLSSMFWTVPFPMQVSYVSMPAVGGGMTISGSNMGLDTSSPSYIQNFEVYIMITQSYIDPSTGIELIDSTRLDCEVVSLSLGQTCIASCPPLVDYLQCINGVVIPNLLTVTIKDNYAAVEIEHPIDFIMPSTHILIGGSARVGVPTKGGNYSILNDAFGDMVHSFIDDTHLCYYSSFTLALVCDYPPGVGWAPAIISVLGSCIIMHPQQTYNPPIIEDCDPPNLAQQQQRSLVIYGSNFGESSSALSVLVYSVPCTNVTIINPHTRIRCILPSDIPAPLSLHDDGEGDDGDGEIDRVPVSVSVSFLPSDPYSLPIPPSMKIVDAHMPVIGGNMTILVDTTSFFSFSLPPIFNITMLGGSTICNTASFNINSNNVTNNNTTNNNNNNNNISNNMIITASCGGLSSLTSCNSLDSFTCTQSVRLVDSANRRSAVGLLVMYLPRVTLLDPSAPHNQQEQRLPTSGGVITFNISYADFNMKAFILNNNNNYNNNTTRARASIDSTLTPCNLTSITSSSSTSLSSPSSHPIILLRCPIPPGVGAGPRLLLSLLNTTYEQAVEYTYDRPTISSVADFTNHNNDDDDDDGGPDSINNNNSNNNSTSINTLAITISGDNYGTVPSAIDVLVGGSPCVNVSIVVPHKTITCTRSKTLTYVDKDIIVTMQVAGLNVSSPYYWSGPTSHNDNNQITSPPNNISNNVPMLIGIALACAVVVVAVVFIALYKARRSAKRTKQLKTALKVKAEDVQLTNVVRKERIGHGAFGSVYKGLWQGVTVALKTVIATAASDIDALRAEATIMKALSHPNIVQLFGFYEDDEGTLYIVSEYMAGGSLDIMLRQSKTKMEMHQLLKMCRDVTAGMIQLEERGIVHCDLACRNLLLSRDRTVVKVSDFGLSRKPRPVLEKGSNSNNINDNNNNSNNNSTGQLPIKWCAPEVLISGSFTSLSDVWSLGVTIWEILAHGAQPFSGMTNSDQFDREVSAPTRFGNFVGRRSIDGRSAEYR